MDTLTITPTLVTPERTDEVTELADQAVTAWLEKAGAPPEIKALIEMRTYVHGLQMAGPDLWPADLLPRQYEIEIAAALGRMWLLISDLVGREAQLTPRAANG